MSQTSVMRTGAVGAATVRSAVRDGAIAGAVSALVFTVVHQLTISPIWFAFVPMLLAGALCGTGIASTFAHLVRDQTLGSWLVFNLVHLGMIAGLMATSLVVFEPVTTMAEVVNAGGPVDHLIVRALPMTVAFIVITTAGMGVVLARRRSDYLRILGSVTALVVLLGLNVSVIGLVDMAGGSLRPLVVFFALIVLLDVAYAAVFAVLQRELLLGPS